MTRSQLLEIVARGEDSRHQFKLGETNPDSLAAELVAFSNSGGGYLLLGVADDGAVVGLDKPAVRRLNQLIGNAASQHVRPPVHLLTENVQVEEGVVVVVQVPNGLAKPYMDNQGRIWVKQGSDKRNVTSREEMQRLFQRAGLVYADAVPVAGTSVADVDEQAFWAYFNRRYSRDGVMGNYNLEQLLQNLGLAEGSELNLAGLMLFGRNPQRYRPAFEVKAVAFPGTVLHDTRYLDSEDFGGTLFEQFRGSLAFLRRNLHHIQGKRGFNTLGEMEIPEQVLEELLVNALIHRDYFTSASIRLMIFADRIEIVSPGNLPDTLSAVAIRQGVTNRRNPTLTGHAVHILPYRGLGSGIPRVLELWPETDLLDDVVAHQFRVVIHRLTPEVTPEVTPDGTPEVTRLLSVLKGEMGRAELMTALGLKDEKHFREYYQHRALAQGLIEMTLPNKPRSRLQKYRLTLAGLALLSKK